MNIISNSLKTFTTESFNSLQSPNTFGITITHQASWWLTSLDSPYFKALEESVKDVWGKEPLKIREGGTVPTIFWLEREFGAPCVHLPLGQVSYSYTIHSMDGETDNKASDAGHLPNERMRLLNLR
jgi:di- and tripeptidase